VNGAAVARLSLRRVTVRDLEIISKESSELVKSIQLMAILSDNSEDDIRNLDATDFNKAGEVVADFLE